MPKSPAHSASTPANGAARNDKMRLDLLLVERELAATRSRARELIKAGHVLINGQPAVRPAQMLLPDTKIELHDDALRHVSRAAVKLSHALAHFGFECHGRIALDIGASTGGFTEILLQHGASHVYAVDVGHGQLHPDIAAQPAVTAMEGRDARSLTAADFAHSLNAMTIDVSFISLIKAIEQPLRLLAPGSWVIALIKPQFEVGRKALGKNGVVKDEAARRRAIERVESWFDQQPGWTTRGVTAAPISGHAGNQEYLIAAEKSPMA